MSELEKLVPEAARVEVGGRIFEVKPLTVRRMVGLTRALSGVLLGEGGDIDMAALVAEHADKIVEAVAVATDEKPDTIYELARDDFIVLAAAVVGAYSDFFVRRAVPALKSAAQKATAAIAGSMQSKGS